jgi:DnaK suppressor protein
MAVKKKKQKPETPKKKKKPAAATGPIGIKPYRPKKGEEYMNDAQMEHFKRVLEIWKEQLRAERSRTVKDMQEEAAVYPDPVDRADQEQRFSLELRAEDRNRKLIKKIDDAIERINCGDYGFCDECGAEIGVKRLDARPTATLCIECKTVAEIREKQIGG